MSGLANAARSVLYGTLFALFWGWIALQSRALDPVLGLALPPGARVVGAILFLIGAAIALRCASTFVTKGRGTPAPFDPPREFVVAGPYRWVRNPMYIGGVILLAGFGLWHRSVAMALFAGLVGLVAHSFVVLYEEPRLEERFGDPYRAYRESVNRWIPKRPGDERSPT